MHERRVLDDMDILVEGTGVRRFTLTMNAIDMTYNALLSERRDDRSREKSSYQIVRNLTRAAASGWASNCRHWEELFDSNPDKPQCCEPYYVQKIEDHKGRSITRLTSWGYFS